MSCVFNMFTYSMFVFLALLPESVGTQELGRVLKDASLLTGKRQLILKTQMIDRIIFTTVIWWMEW